MSENSFELSKSTSEHNQLLGDDLFSPRVANTDCIARARAFPAITFAKGEINSTISKNPGSAYFLPLWRTKTRNFRNYLTTTFLDPVFSRRLGNWMLNIPPRRKWIEFPSNTITTVLCVSEVGEVAIPLPHLTTITITNYIPSHQ